MADPHPDKRRLTVAQIVDEITKPQEYAAVPPEVWREVLAECVREALADDAREAAEPKPMTLRQIAAREGCTPERIRQLEAKALLKCRRFARRRLRVEDPRELLFERDVRLHQGIRRLR